LQNNLILSEILHRNQGFKEIRIALISLLAAYFDRNETGLKMIVPNFLNRIQFLNFFSFTHNPYNIAPMEICS
jgi:hypothetical protein